MITLEDTLGPVAQLRSLYNKTGQKEIKQILDNMDSDYYNKKTDFSSEEDVAIKLFFNCIALDELCEALGCSHVQLIDRARVLGLAAPHESITAEDVEICIKCLESGMPIDKVCEVFGIDIPEHSYRMTKIEREQIKDAFKQIENQIDMFNTESED